MNPIFKTKLQVMEHAAAMVADWWLQNSDHILARGEKPSPFTPNAVYYCRCELDRAIYPRNLVRWIDCKELALLSKCIAVAKLRAGSYSELCAYFKANPFKPCDEFKISPIVESKPIDSINRGSVHWNSLK